jgi:hypothetical protein
MPSGLSFSLQFRPMYRVRLLVLWLMVFAVPLQAFAAAAMAFCEPASAAATAGARADHRAHGHSHAQGGEGDESHAAHAADRHASAAHHSDPTGDDSAAQSSDTMHKCGSCGACHGTALTCTLELAVFQGLPRADLIEPPSAVATVAPRLLDRPPRA